MKLNPMELITRMDINWRAARFIAIGYLALSALDFVLLLPIGYLSVGALWLLVFLSGPAGILLALVTTPISWIVTTLSLYFGGTCLLAPFLALSCHRHPLVSGACLFVAVLLWLVAGFCSAVYVFAFAA